MSLDAPAAPPPSAGRTGVLLVNLGTPDALGYWPVRRYLKEFLSDRRVIETNRALWWVILNGIILTVRPTRSGRRARPGAPRCFAQTWEITVAPRDSAGTRFTHRTPTCPAAARNPRTTQVAPGN